MKKLYLLIFVLFSYSSLSSQTVIFDGPIYTASNSGVYGASASVGNLKLDKFGRLYLSSNIYYGIPTQCCDNRVYKIDPWTNNFQCSNSGPGLYIPYINFKQSEYYWDNFTNGFHRKNPGLLLIPFANGFQSKVFIDNHDNMFISNGDSIYKIDSTGIIISSFNIDVDYITGDEQNNLFIVTDSLRKYNSTGNVLWSYPYNGNDMFVDSIGNSYFTDSGGLTKLNSGGLLEFIRAGFPSGLISVDGSSNIYIADTNNLYKYNATADTLIWSYPLTEVYSSISVDSHQNCYLARAVNGSSGVAYLKILSSLPSPDSILITLVSDTALCSGDSLEVYFDVTGMQNYVSSYKVELSDTAGSFSSGSLILAYGQGSPIKTRIPPYIPSSSNYTIRVEPVFNVQGISSQSFPITIHRPVAISFSISNYFKMCSNSPPVAINPQPTGGILSGPGITGTIFYPDSVSAPGVYDFSYTVVDSNGCLATGTRHINLLLNPVSSVTILTSSDSICKGDTLQLSGIPGGGIFGGQGLTNNIFYSDSTLSQTNMVEYSIVSMVNNFACTTSTSKVIYIYPITPINFNYIPDTVCLFSSPFLINVSPTGGILTGNGILGNTFYPDSVGPGLNPINYTFLSNNGCTEHSSINVYVDYCLGVSFNDDRVEIIKFFPNPVSDILTITSSLPLKNSQIQILELNGRLVYEETFSGTKEVVNVSTLSKGLYVFRITSNSERIFTQKFAIIER